MTLDHMDRDEEKCVERHGEYRICQTCHRRDLDSGACGRTGQHVDYDEYCEFWTDE